MTLTLPFIILKGSGLFFIEFSVFWICLMLSHDYIYIYIYYIYFLLLLHLFAEYETFVELRVYLLTIEIWQLYWNIDHPLKVCNSVAFNIFTEVCSLTVIDLENFHYPPPKRTLKLIGSHSLFLPLSKGSGIATTDIFYLSILYNEVTVCNFLCVYLSYFPYCYLTGSFML